MIDLQTQAGIDTRYNSFLRAARLASVHARALSARKNIKRIAKPVASDLHLLLKEKFFQVDWDQLNAM